MKRLRVVASVALVIALVLLGGGYALENVSNVFEVTDESKLPQVDPSTVKQADPVAFSFTAELVRFTDESRLAWVVRDVESGKHYVLRIPGLSPDHWFDPGERLSVVAARPTGEAVDELPVLVTADVDLDLLDLPANLPDQLIDAVRIVEDRLPQQLVVEVTGHEALRFALVTVNIEARGGNTVDPLNIRRLSDPWDPTTRARKLIFYFDQQDAAAAVASGLPIFLDVWIMDRLEKQGAITVQIR